MAGMIFWLMEKHSAGNCVWWYVNVCSVVDGEETETDIDLPLL